MFSNGILFSVLVTLVGLVSASPLPMPAVKQSNGMAARHFRHDPVWTDGTPCWHGGRFGYLKDRSCALVDVDVDVSLVKRHGGVPFANGDPCWNDDKFGSIEGAVCVAAEVEVKRSYAPYPYGQPVWLDGTPCWQGGRFGYLKDQNCGLIDIDLDLNLLGLGGNRHNYYHPYFVDGTPCWNDRRFGYISQSQCSVIDIDADLDILKRGNYYTYNNNGQPIWLDGSPCYQDGRFGYFQNALCIVADLDVNVKRDVALEARRQPIWNDGTACWRGGRFGYLKNRECALVDADVKVNLKKRAFYPEFANGGPCWNENRFGYITDNACIVDIDIDATLAKRSLGGLGGEGLVGELLGGPDYRFANYHPGNVPPPSPLLGVAGFKRNGLLHHAPSGNTLDSAGKTVGQLLDHSVTKRDVLDGGLLRSGYYDDDDVVAHLAGEADLGHGRPLGLKRQLGPLSGLTGGKKGGKKGGMGGLDGVTGLLG